ncbi:hypothetical protein C8J56DRAFT_1100726 [Mycena floridula]|nr:hypothetical protein C8J56DRAFT_1100726 [Mycena floridula]
MGGGLISIILEGDYELWGEDFVLDKNSRNRVLVLPNAVIALNTGLFTYKTWTQVFNWCQILAIPLGSTDYHASYGADCEKELPNLFQRLGMMQ